jgi:small ubiquitin-related modifier
LYRNGRRSLALCFHALNPLKLAAHPYFLDCRDRAASIKKTGEETFFKIKKSTRMQKVFDTYAQRKGIQATSLRFLLDGEKIGPDQTPKMLELDDQDQIDCMLEQVRRRKMLKRV